jgi:hypothetical protein
MMSWYRKGTRWLTVAIDVVLKDGSTTRDGRLDRLVQFDERSRAYRAVDGLEMHPLRSYTWRCDSWLNQGAEGSCVGHAWAHELAARPAVVPVSSATAIGIYHRAQSAHDPWPGGAYPGASPFYEGTSVLGGAKAVMELQNAKGEQFIEGYRWIFGLEDGVRVVGYRGPVVLGINWYSGMFNVDVDGYIRRSGYVAGGHAILWHSVKCIFSSSGKNFADLDLERSYAVLHNSWGRTLWGVEGRAKISLADLGALLMEDGEGCLAVKRNR